MLYWYRCRVLGMCVAPRGAAAGCDYRVPGTGTGYLKPCPVSRDIVPVPVPGYLYMGTGCMRVEWEFVIQIEQPSEPSPALSPTCQAEFSRVPVPGYPYWYLYNKTPSCKMRWIPL